MGQSSCSAPTQAVRSFIERDMCEPFALLVERDLGGRRHAPTNGRQIYNGRHQVTDGVDDNSQNINK